MKIKKLLAALAACTMAFAMFSLTVSAEGATGNEDSVDDTIDDTTDDTIDDGEDAIDDGADEGEDAIDGSADEAEDTTADNPGTGNSPIALAVIPVALAAAAVVAKKAK